MDSDLTNESIISNPSKLSSHMKNLSNPQTVTKLMSLRWLNLASAHPKILTSLSHISMSIQSAGKPSHTKLLISQLLANLKPDLVTCSSLPSPSLYLGTKHFSSATELKKTVHSVLFKHGISQQITGEEKELLEELFFYHPTGPDKLKGMTGISVGVHKEHHKETRCFVIEKQGETTEISYIKAIGGFVQTKQQEAEQQVFKNQYLVADKLIEILASVLESNPVMLSYCKQQIQVNFPHWRLDLHTHKFFLRNMFSLAKSVKSLQEFLVSLAIEKLIEIESEGLVEKLDSLLAEFFEYINSEMNDQLFQSILHLFKKLVLPTHETHYVQQVMVSICISHKEEYKELFLSSLLKQVFSDKHVEISTAYIVSYLAQHPGPLLTSAKYLVYYCLRRIKQKSTQHLALQVLKYLLFLMASKPELTKDQKLMQKLNKLLDHPIKPLSYIALHQKLNYTSVLKGREQEGRFGNFHLPFHCDLSSLKCSAQFLGLRKKRPRNSSFDGFARKIHFSKPQETESEVASNSDTTVS